MGRPVPRGHGEPIAIEGETKSVGATVAKSDNGIMGCPGARRGHCSRLAQLVGKKIAVAVPEVGECLFV
ncbi:hypothetical protein STRTUCAR8_01766 [Streptomyces turgidiscabies Car8]|uniref:Uncharacterized protein n=1 Tax=Streptomyces turgidiscabies (strain Car8) TaxID=698760 RepID=L7F481_STRT8|nr:hypothetical protein STRTUCAR8_01766 [Streptomyces turgidiscabies Car8]